MPGCSDLAEDATELISNFANGPMGDVYCVNLTRIMELLRGKELEVSIRRALHRLLLHERSSALWDAGARRR